MKKKLIIYNMIILLCTGITICVLVNINNQTYKFEEQFNGPINEVINESENNLNEESEQENQQDGEAIISEENQNQENKENEETIKEDISKNNQVKNENRCEDPSEYEGFYVGEKKEDISVFKVDNTKIISSLTASEKAILLYIGNKLPREEFNKLTKALNNKNHEKAVIKAYEILRDKLSSKDFEKVKGIFSKYINLDVLEKKV